MNFLAHFIIARRLWFPPPTDLPAYIVGSALPDLIGLAAPRVRLRERRDPLAPNNGGTGKLGFSPSCPNLAPPELEAGGAVRAGVRAHLAADAAFHKTAAFAQAQAEVGALLEGAGFAGIRVRRFFVAHVLTELALDAVLLRADPTLGEQFYAAFASADFEAVTRWAEGETGRPLPRLPDVLARFAASHYLLSYATDAGVATGLSRTCERARQDGFEGENFTRLVPVVAQSMRIVAARAEGLLAETCGVPGTGSAGLLINEESASGTEDTLTPDSPQSVVAE